MKTTMRGRPVRIAAVAALAIATVSLTPAAQAATNPNDRADIASVDRAVTTVARTDAGTVRGKLDSSAGAEVVRFSGIPYAAPPVGARRWTAPQPPRPWTGIRDATVAGSICPQTRRDQNDQPVVVGAEDCLTLDVVAPVKRSRPGRLPVLVWLYGGNLTSGAGSQYDGARLAAGGDVIVVTVNYRLGALGFLAADSLDHEGTVSGGYGFLDQAEALRWVRRNAAAFGGNAGRVTLAGQSAGARSVCTHLAAPSSRGLFQRAIIQSGACAVPVMSKAEAERKGTEAIRQIGCSDATDTASCLRAASLAGLLGALADPNRPVTGQRRDDPWGPVAGTPYLPLQPIDAIRHGAAAGIPLLIGSTHDEMRPFVLSRHGVLTPDGYAAQIHATFGGDADEVLKHYPVGNFPSPALALATVLTDWGGGIGACPTLATAQAASRHAPVYAYEFLEGDPPIGAYHGLDLPYLWDTSIPLSQYPDYADMTPDQQRLSQAMIDYWTTFADRGNPNTTNRPRWEQAHGRSTSVLGLAGDAIKSTPFAADHKCQFWRSR